MFFADPLWPWLSPPLAALRYVMYFRFIDDVTCGHSGLYGDGCKAEPLTYYHWGHCDTGTESDVCECLVVVVPVVSEAKHRINCVFLEDLYASLDGQEWLDVDCLDQVLIANVYTLFCY